MVRRHGLNDTEWQLLEALRWSRDRVPTRPSPQRPAALTGDKGYGSQAFRVFYDRRRSGRASPSTGIRTPTARKAVHGSSIVSRNGDGTSSKVLWTGQGRDGVWRHLSTSWPRSLSI